MSDIKKIDISAKEQLARQEAIKGICKQLEIITIDDFAEIVRVKFPDFMLVPALPYPGPFPGLPPRPVPEMPPKPVPIPIPGPVPGMPPKPVPQIPGIPVPPMVINNMDTVKRFIENNKIKPVLSLKPTDVHVQIGDDIFLLNNEQLTGLKKDIQNDLQKSSTIQF